MGYRQNTKGDIPYGPLVKLVDKILMHFFFDLLHERSLIIDIQIVISIALETSYKL